MKLSYDFVTVNQKTYYLFASDHGLYYVSGENEDIKKNAIHQNEIVHDAMKMKQYIDQLKRYLLKETKSFDFPLHLSGTLFEQEVYKALLLVPYGKTATYTDIANKIGRPKSVRAVANAIGKNKLTIVVPCHRIIRKDQSLGGYSFGLDMKKSLLKLEEINY